jgi:hypothetical protein
MFLLVVCYVKKVIKRDKILIGGLVKCGIDEIMQSCQLELCGR